MKEFNLELAKEGHPLVTRDGREVSEFHCFESLGKDTDRIAAIIDDDGFWFNKSGQYYSNNVISGKDLFLKDCDWQPPLKMGDIVEVFSHNKAWEERIFIKNGGNDEIICVRDGQYNYFLAGKPFETYLWDKDSWRRKQTEDKKVNINIEITINGKPAKLSDISEETLKKLRETGL